MAAAAGPEPGVEPPAEAEPRVGVDPLEEALLVAEAVVEEVLRPPPPLCSLAVLDHRHFLLDFLAEGKYESLWACPPGWGKHLAAVAIPPIFRFPPHPSKYRIHPAGYALVVPRGLPWLPHAMEISNLYGNFFERIADECYVSCYVVLGQFLNRSMSRLPELALTLD